MTPRLALGAACLVAVAACGSVGSPGLSPAGYDPDWMLDVLSPEDVPALTDPRFEPIAGASWASRHPVAVLRIGREIRGFPLGVLARHEVVNLTLAGRPIVVAYSPLTGAALAWDRAVAGRTLSFAASGKLYRSGTVLFDRQTTSLWPVLLGVAVEGPLRSSVLTRHAVSIASIAELRRAAPDAFVLAPPVAGLDYGESLYQGYDTRSGPLAAFRESNDDPRLPAMTRVVGVSVGEVARAYPIEAPAVIHDAPGALEIVVLSVGSAASALDAREIGEARIVGGSGVYRSEGDRFVVAGGTIADAATGSRWSVLGIAIDGPRKGERLEPVAALDTFWFAWAAAHPGSSVWRPA